MNDERGETRAGSQPLRRVTIKVTESTYRELRERAETRHLSLTGLIREALATDRYLNDLKAREDASAPSEQ